jgi:hypothetical protein
MRRWHVVAFFVSVIAGCSSGGSSPPDENGGTSGAAAAGAGGGGGKSSGGSSGSAQGGAGSGGVSGGGGSGGTPQSSGGAAGEGTPDAGSGGAGGAAGSDGGGAAGAAGSDGGGANAGPANPANVIWYADPAKGDTPFKNVESTGGCTITVIDDPDHGKVRKFNRPPGTNRCEVKGAATYNTKEGDLVYVGMRYKIDAPMDLTVTSIFQWKTYDTPGHPNTLNFPILIRPSAGKLNVEAQKLAAGGAGGGLSGGNVIWSIPTPIGQWFTIVLGIKQSYDSKLGWIEVYYNGQQQKLADGSMRVAAQTLDGGDINPKWGMYGTTSSPKPQSSSTIGDIRIARDYPSAAPESY